MLCTKEIDTQIDSLVQNTILFKIKIFSFLKEIWELLN